MSAFNRISKLTASEETIFIIDSVGHMNAQGAGLKNLLRKQYSYAKYQQKRQDFMNKKFKNVI